MKHTPGEWTIHRDGNGDVIESKSFTVAHIIHWSDDPENMEQFIANAYLIAIAPKLVEALEAVEWVPILGTNWMFCPWCENSDYDGHSPDCQRQAAIAKAKGDT